MFLQKINKKSPQNQFQRQPAPRLTMYTNEHWWVSFVPTVTRGSFSNGDGDAKANIKKQ